MDTIPQGTPEHKLNPQTTFIYALIDPRDNAIRYIGKANDPQHRFQVHIRSCEKEATHKGRWIKGLKLLNLAPLLKIVEEIPFDRWKEREAYWIQYYHSQGAPLTNGTAGGDGMQSPTPEVRAALSRAHKGKPRPDVSAARKGKKRPPEVGAKVSASQTGKILSEEHKRKISVSRTGKKYPNISTSMKGRKLSPESIEKRSTAVRGRKRPPEVGAKVSATKTGTKRPPFSDEWRKNIGDSVRGRKHSPEAIEKMSLARKKWHAMRNSSPPDAPTLWD